MAFEIIRAVCRGGIVRRRRRLLLEEARAKVARTKFKLMQGINIKHSYSTDTISAMRRQKLKPLQDENASKNLARYTESLDTGELKTLCCHVAKLSLATGSELADIAEECDFQVGPYGLFELEEEDLESCLELSEKLQHLFAHVDAIQMIKKSIAKNTGVASAYFQVCVSLCLRQRGVGRILGGGRRKKVRKRRCVCVCMSVCVCV